ncbi:uncharacterized protein BP5553_03583 [Venustampulla echinocandica]|uniref:Uncharacterized protein n=1 Tax=Venustampulla echinocandica TaxID=2656787 RepID=A0A370TUN1_9HELO|nr:uncharacterized protein BP5553_03583 [Venustampulla echinocandica]RDL39243.1 hypothetical protein BP5553_03583 [Venustampulla echinocandica]
MDEFENKETESPPSTTCSMAQSGSTGKRCKYKYRSTKSPRSHRSHACHAHRDGQSKGLVCYDHSTIFRNIHDFRVHLIMLHSAPSSIIALESSLGEIAPETLVFWCKFCEVWIPRKESSEDEHFPSHIGNVDSAIARYCRLPCTGLSSQFRRFPHQRSFFQHVEGHLQAVGAGEHMVCPAASATANGIPAQCADIEALDKECLAKHLVDAHGLLIDANKFVKANDSTD